MIHADLVCGKLEWMEANAISAGALCAPERFKELLWFIQSLSMTPRGLENFAESLIRDYPVRFISEAIGKIGVPENGKWTQAQCLAFWKDNRSEKVSMELQRSRCHVHNVLHSSLDYYKSNAPWHPNTFEQWKHEQLTEAADFNHYADFRVVASKAIQAGDCKNEIIIAGVERFNFAFFHAECLTTANDDLLPFLKRLCVEKTEPRNPWYCYSLLSMLVETMDRHAKEQRATIAETEVTRMVFRKLDFALAEKVAVQFVGNSRIGKTTSLSVWCSLRPGRARLVTVPASNRMRDFIEAHADAFGIEHLPSMSLATITSLVKHVHKSSGLFIAYDESQGLIPTTYSKHTCPTQLNYVRFEVIDRKRGAAFFATPQSHKQTLDQFTQKTGYAMEQWLGRLLTVVLPSDYGSLDMLAMTRRYFPDFTEAQIKLIAARAMRTEGYTYNLELLSKTARFIASEQGRARFIWADAQAGMLELWPDAARVTIIAPSATPATPAPLTALPQPVRRAAAATPRRRGIEPISAPVPARVTSEIETTG